VKVFIQGATQLPANKQVRAHIAVLHVSLLPRSAALMCLQKLTLEGRGVLKDTLTLAFYNVTSGTEFSLQLKTRGGK
jgi:hypothetical protein